MNIFGILKNGNYKVIDQDENWLMIKTPTKNVFYLENNNNDFVMERECFEYLDFQKAAYAIVLYNNIERQYFYLDFKSGYNWVKKNFESCEKERIHLGRRILNNNLSEEELIRRLR